MNKIQLRRWKKVSMGLARDCHTELTIRRRLKLQEEVAECIAAVVSNYRLKDINNWDCTKDSVSVRDAVAHALAEYYHVRSSTRKPFENRFRKQVTACVRAGFNLAVAPSGGVVRFTIGDLRTVFKRRLPTWVTALFEPPLTGKIGDEEPVWL